MRILFIGDIVGRPGRRAAVALLEQIASSEEFDLVIANGENAAGGFGITPEIADRLLDAGVHVLTSGNHVWDKKQIFGYLDRQPRLLRPANYPDAPGAGLYVGQAAEAVPFAVANFQGRVHMPATDCPFRCADRLLAELDPQVRVRIIDFHAEVTSEKTAFGIHLDGRASAVIGTHTHVPTADERVLAGGTAFIADVGMTGPAHSVIGMRTEQSMRRFLTALPARFEPAAGPVRLNAVEIEVDPGTGKALSIRRRAEQFD